MYELVSQPSGDTLAARLDQTLTAALAETGEEWPERCAGALFAVLDLLAADPAAAASIVPADPPSSAHEALLAGLESVLAEGRRRYPKAETLPSSTEKVLARGALALVAERVRTGEDEGIAGLAPQLVASLLAPYAGAKRARRAASIVARRQARRALVAGPAVAYRPLPAGQHGISPEQVAGDQRQRMLAAITQLLAERGYAHTPVDDVVERAHVSKRTFYDRFENIDACLLAAYEDAESRLWAIATAAARSEGAWPEEVAAALRAVLEFFADEPATVHLLGREGQLADARIATAQREATARLSALLRRGRSEMAQAAELPDAVEAALIDNVATIVYSYILRGEAERLPELAPGLIELLLSPYLGAEEARRVAGTADD